MKGKNIKSMFALKPAPIPAKTIYDLRIDAVYTRAISDVVLGKKNINDYLRETQEMTEKKLAELKK
ncbi:hypothetical protein [Paenibacillus ginsengarvi]|uniref:Uncharacterized protein n=1 Tax=Paenibacillus ginsengarvi TaxID=400777 RepID=A0A3B0BRC3_9BACL|nr:hypothetical protein [Paenibacillus ginsengarvi]RKN75823.1 hypothetical protein D7M11_25290 [Paenibacillus ginsengarvi]